MRNLAAQVALFFKIYNSIKQLPQEELDKIKEDVTARLDDTTPFEILQKNIDLLKNEGELPNIQKSIKDFQQQKNNKVEKIKQLLDAETSTQKRIKKLMEVLRNNEHKDPAIIQAQELLRKQTVFIASQNDRLAELQPTTESKKDESSSISILTRIIGFVNSLDYPFNHTKNVSQSDTSPHLKLSFKEA